MSELRITASGTALTVGALATIAAGLIGRYRELTIIGVMALLLVALIVLAPRRKAGLHANRRLKRVLVQRGDPVEARILIRPETTATPTATFTDQLDKITVEVQVPALDADEEFEATYRWTGMTRGAHIVGPLREERWDPFGLTVRADRHDETDEVLVHPVVHQLGRVDSEHSRHRRSTPFSSISDDPLSELRALREYQPGDDPRLIHWPSTARTGMLVVRDFLDLRQNARLILLDTSDTNLTAPEFEDAVEIAASLAISYLQAKLATVVRTSDPEAPGSVRPVKDRDEILKLLARVQRCRASDALGERSLLSQVPSAGAIQLICGPRSAMLHPLLASSAMRNRVSVIRIAQRRPLAALNVPTIDVSTSVEFARTWRMTA